MVAQAVVNKLKSPTRGQPCQEHRLVMSKLMSRTVQADALSMADANKIFQSRKLRWLAWETESFKELAPPSSKQSLQLPSSLLCTTWC